MVIYVQYFDSTTNIVYILNSLNPPIDPKRTKQYFDQMSKQICSFTNLRPPLPKTNEWDVQTELEVLTKTLEQLVLIRALAALQ